MDLLEDLGEVPSVVRDAICAETDRERLRRMLKLAAKADDIEDFCEKSDFQVLR